MCCGKVINSLKIKQREERELAAKQSKDSEEGSFFKRFRVGRKKNEST